jgi:hypothetical protein
LFSAPKVGITLGKTFVTSQGQRLEMIAIEKNSAKRGIKGNREQISNKQIIFK